MKNVFHERKRTALVAINSSLTLSIDGYLCTREAQITRLQAGRPAEIIGWVDFDKLIVENVIGEYAHVLDFSKEATADLFADIKEWVGV